MQHLPWPVSMCDSFLYVSPLAISWLHLTLARRRTQKMRRLCIVVMVCSWLLVLGSFILGNSVVYNIMKDFHTL